MRHALWYLVSSFIIKDFYSEVNAIGIFLTKRTEQKSTKNDEIERKNEKTVSLALFSYKKAKTLCEKVDKI